MEFRTLRKSAILTAWIMCLSLLTFFQIAPAKAAVTLDASAAAFVFDHSGSAGTGATAFTAKYANIVGDGKSNGNIVRYNTVATVAGIAIDAVITTTLSGTTISVYDSPGSASSNTNYFQVDKPASTGSITFNFAFYEHGTYTVAGSGNPVVLQNIKIFSIDIDGGDQYTSFSGFQNYYLTSSPATNLLVSQPSAGLVRFTSKSGVGNNSAIPQDQVQVQYLSLSSINIQVGNGNSIAYFGIGFGAASWGSATVPTATPNPYNAAPTSTDTTKIVTASTNTFLTQSDFGNYSDADGNPFTQVKITQLPSSGKLQFSTGGIWSDVTLNQVILVSDINLNKLRMNVPSGGTFKFMVHDSAAYSAASYTLTYTVTAQSQTITFANPGTKILAVGTIASGATASSGLTVTLASSTVGICTVSGLNISLVAEGACTIVANQAGNVTYSAATSVTQTFYISSNAAQTITFADPGTKVLNPNPLTVASGATSSSTGTISLTSFTTNVCTISGLNIVLIATGSCQVRADQPGGLIGGITYAPASPVERIFAVIPVTYTLTYTAGSGGTISGSTSQTVASGTAGTAVTPTPNSGYHFTNWTDGSTANPRTDSNVTSNISQQANFAINTYTVTYNGNGSTGGSAPTGSPDTVNYNATATVKANTGSFVQTGYTFAGWNTAADGTGTSYAATGAATFTMGAANVILYAVWTRATFGITYSANAGSDSVASMPSNATKSYGTTFVLSSNTPTRTGYTFSKWNTQANGSGTDYDKGSNYTTEAAQTFYAKWTIDSHTITYNGNGSTSGAAPTGSPDTFNYNATATVKANSGTYAKTGYTFNGWNTAANGSGTSYAATGSVTFTMSTADIVLYAQWTGNQYVYDANTGTGTTGPQTYAGSALNALSNSFTPPTGYQFSQWCTTQPAVGSTCGGTSIAAGGSLSTPGASTVRLYAVWTIKTYGITVATVTHGSISPTTQNYNHGANQNFTFTPDTGYYLASVTIDSVALTAENLAQAKLIGYTFTSIAAAHTVSATFSPTVLTISYSGGAGSTGSAPTTPVEVTYGSTFTTPANTYAKSGYTFAGWSDGTTSYLANATYPSTGFVTGNVSLTATWTANSYTIHRYDNYAGAETTGTCSKVTYTTGTAVDISLCTPTRASYTFVGWATTSSSTDAVQNPYSPAIPSSGNDISVYAIWTQATIYTVTYHLKNTSDGDPTNQVGFIAGSSALTLLTGDSVSKTGYSLSGWCTTNINPCASPSVLRTGLYSPTVNVDLYAVWTGVTYTVTYLHGPDGTGGPATQSFEFPGNVTLKVATDANTTFTRAGYKVTGWTTDSSSGAAQTHALSKPYSTAQNLTLYPVWTLKTNTITYNANDHAVGISPVPSPVTLTTGSTTKVATLGSLTRQSYTFTGWYTNETGTAGTAYAPNADITLNEDITLYAQWIQDSFNGVSMSDLQLIGTWTANVDEGFNITVSKTTTSGATSSVGVVIPANSLPATTELKYYLVDTFSYANSKIGSSPHYVVDILLTWVKKADYTVPDADKAKPIVLTIENSSIRANADLYMIIGGTSYKIDATTLTSVGASVVSIQNGKVVLNVIKDPQLIVQNITYRVTYNDSYKTSGSVPTDSNSYLGNGTFVVPGQGDLLKTGFTFGGWCTVAVAPNVTCSGTKYLAGSTFTFSDQDANLYAIWSANTLNITYNFGGATSTSGGAATTIYGGTISTLPTQPTRAGYSFNGWFTASADGTQITTSDPHGQSSNFTLYAQWSANPLTITYNFTGASSTTGGSTSTITGGTVSSLPADPTKSGYTFNGWFTASTGGSQILTGGAHGQSANFTLYAQWVPLGSNTITFNSNSGSGTMSNQSTNVSTAITTNTFTRTGYSFTVWNTESGGGGTTYADGATYSFAASITLYAQWSANTLNITYDTNGGSSITGGEATTVTGGTISSLPEDPTQAGYTFKGWFTASTSGTQFTTTSPHGQTANFTVYAQWTPIGGYSITFNPNGGSGSMSNQSSLISTAITSNTFARSGYTFTGWNTQSGGGGTAYSNGATYDFSSSITLYAQWHANAAPPSDPEPTPPVAPAPAPTPAPAVVTLYTVSYMANSATSGVVPSEPATYANGSSVIAKTNSGALARTDYTFAGWNTKEDGTGITYAADGKTSFIVGGQNVVLYAKWALVSKFSVTYNGNLNTAGSVPVDTTTYPVGATFTVKTNSGLLSKTTGLFVGWNTKANGAGTSYAPGATVVMGTANVTLYAQWQPVSTHKISLYPNNATSGTVPMISDRYKEGDIVGIPMNTGNLQKTGFTFVGWNTMPDGSGTSYPAGGAVKIGKANLMLFAMWIKSTTPSATDSKISFEIYYAMNSYALDAKSRKLIEEKVASVRNSMNASSEVTIRITGWVQPTKISPNVQFLSTNRAQVVAKYMKALGFKGTYILKFPGHDKDNIPASRHATVEISWTNP